MKITIEADSLMQLADQLRPLINGQPQHGGFSIPSGPIKVSQLGLKVRSFNALMADKIETVDEADGGLVHDLLRVPNMGRSSASEVMSKIMAYRLDQLAESGVCDPNFVKHLAALASNLRAVANA